MIRKTSQKKRISSRNTFDIYSIGHFIFGFALTGYITIFVKHFFTYNLIFVALIFGFLVIGLWEILEHTIIKDLFYKPTWKESQKNVLGDIGIGFISFGISFIFIFILYFDSDIPLYYFIFLHVVIFFFIIYLIVSKKRR